MGQTAGNRYQVVGIGLLHASCFMLYTLGCSPTKVLTGSVSVPHPLYSPVKEESWAWATINFKTLEDPERGLEQRAMIKVMTRDLVVVEFNLEHTSSVLADAQGYQGILQDNQGRKFQPVSTRVKNHLDHFTREVQKPFWRTDQYNRSWVWQDRIEVLHFYASSAIFTFRSKDLIRDSTKWLSFEAAGPQRLKFVVEFESR